MSYFKDRQKRKHAKDLLRHSRYVRHMREDISAPDLLEKLTAAEQGLKATLKTQGSNGLDPAISTLEKGIHAVMPPAKHPVVREYVEIIVVALAVAMACRAYFIQPFKIPTGSMEPTLHGIYSIEQSKPTVMDRMPLKLLKWFYCGGWYSTVRIEAPGQLGAPATSLDKMWLIYYVAGKPYKVPADANVNYRLGTYLKKDAVLWSGLRVSGDHLFVDKVSWNFRRPRRSEVMVFLTNGIEDLRPQWNKHYIKRTAGLPGDTLIIQPPELIVNGTSLVGDGSIAGRISSADGYAGYLLPETLASSSQQALRNGIRVRDHHYFALGDNSGSSLDSRYWGYVPEQNLVGPGWFIYWPLNRWSRVKP